MITITSDGNYKLQSCDVALMQYSTDYVFLLDTSRLLWCHQDAQMSIFD